MRIDYIDESRALIRKENADYDEPYDIGSIVSEAVSVKTARDFVDFLQHVPFSFLGKFCHVLEGEEHTMNFVDERPDVAERRIESHPFKGSIVEAVNKHFPEIDVIDRCLLLDGTLGSIRTYMHEFPDGEKMEMEVIDLNSKYLMMYNQMAEMAIQDVRALATLAAVGNGETQGSRKGCQELPGRCLRTSDIHRLQRPFRPGPSVFRVLL